MGESCKACQHCRVAEWEVLSDRQLRHVERVRRERRFLPGEAIFHEGDDPSGIYFVSSGLVGLRKVDPQGESALLRLIGPGGTFGYRSLLAGETHGVGAEALKRTELCHLPATAASRMTAETPALAMRFFKYLAGDLTCSDAKILEAATASSRERFLRLLLVLGAPDAASRRIDGETCSLELPLSRQDLASMIGVRPESMSRVIRHIESDGLARFDGRHVEIPNLSRLLAACAGSTEN